MEQPTTKSHYAMDWSYLVKDTLNWIEQIKEKAIFDERHRLTCDFVAIKDILKGYMMARHADIRGAYILFINNEITMEHLKILFQGPHSYDVMGFAKKFFHGEAYKITITGSYPVTPRLFFYQWAEKINKILAGQGNFNAQENGYLTILMKEYLYVLDQCIMFISDVRFGHNGNASQTEMDTMKDILDFITYRLSKRILRLKSHYGNLLEDGRRLLRDEFNGCFEKDFKADYGGGTNTLYEDIQTNNPKSITNIKFGVGSVDLLLVHLASCLEVGHSA
ncbi:hypothetical protein H4219_005789 [Mycoemilia scoparia]|uniref:Uncharacterized protein n=1 Tax=Mycoemilia scoparia TaxID=417184 RepID=A0A9W7ZLG1_9FUNG|nr:hypothetical protein H4219_005789 [Mycoemilia scoparia]